jgi:hypothetical protein
MERSTRLLSYERATELDPARSSTNIAYNSIQTIFKYLPKQSLSTGVHRVRKTIFPPQV